MSFEIWVFIVLCFSAFAGILLNLLWVFRVETSVFYISSIILYLCFCVGYSYDLVFLYPLFNYLGLSLIAFICGYVLRCDDNDRNKVQEYESGGQHLEKPIYHVDDNANNKIKIDESEDKCLERPFYHIDDYMHNMEYMECDIGVRQLNMLQKKYDNFKEIISYKLSTEELSYAHYYDMVEKMYLTILDNLKECFFLLRLPTSIDNEYLLSRLNKLDDNNNSIEGKYEKEILQQYLSLWGQQTDFLNSLLAQNEQALTELDLITDQIVKIDMSKSGSRASVGIAISDLNRLSTKLSLSTY